RTRFARLASACGSTRENLALSGSNEVTKMGTATMHAAAPLASANGPTAAGRWRPARITSVLILLLMLTQSVCGLWIAGVYRDPPEVVAMLRGYDLVTLAVVVPALALSVLPPWHGTRGARLVWLSTLAYGVYNYA